MKAILLAVIAFGLGIFLADFVKAQIKKLERKNG